MADDPDILKFNNKQLLIFLNYTYDKPFSTHKNPTKNRSIANKVKLFVNDDKIERINAINSVGRITYCLPFVSAKKPQTYDGHMIPNNDTAPKIPLRCVVRFKSHSETGNT